MFYSVMEVKRVVFISTLWYNSIIMLTNILYITGGFYFLIKGADALVSGASSIARKLGVSALVVGLSVVAFGTSAPELFVNLIATVNGSTEIAIGNVLGSNLANMLLILGICAMITRLTLKSTTIWKEIPFSLLAAVLVLVFGSDIWLDGGAMNIIGRVEGIAFLSFFVIFLFYIFGLRTSSEHATEQIETFSTMKSIAYTLAGLVGLAVGGQFVVNGATGIALGFGVSSNLIALTVVALGTSLPELVTSVVAARKGHLDMAIGNIVGSNIFNILFVLGVSAVVIPLPFAGANLMDAAAVIVATLFLFIALFLGQKKSLGKIEGFALVSIYLVYMIFAVVRG